jgi:hypothetical protein
MAEFYESLKAGDVGEIAIVKRILRQHPQAFIDKGTRPDSKKKAKSDWDIWIPEVVYGIEVKMDYKSNYTPNYLIEVEMSGVLSALSVTKAKYWVFITGKEYIWITPLEIYRFLEQHFEYGRVPIKGNGDTNKKIAHLVIKEHFKEHVRKLDKEYGWIEMIKKTDVMYLDNFLKLDIEKYLEVERKKLGIE